MSDGQSCFAGEKILVVDDDAVIVKLTGLLLKKWGFDTVSASNGEECLLMVERLRPALVLLDYMMPVMNGLEALRLIRQYYPDTSVIMFTGKGSEEVAVELMKAGAADYLRKPFVNGNLKKRIEKVLFARKVELENRELLHEREVLQLEIKLWNEKLETSLNWLTKKFYNRKSWRHWGTSLQGWHTKFVTPSTRSTCLLRFSRLLRVLMRRILVMSIKLFRK